MGNINNHLVLLSSKNLKYIYIYIPTCAMTMIPTNQNSITRNI